MVMQKIDALPSGCSLSEKKRYMPGIETHFMQYAMQHVVGSCAIRNRELTKYCTSVYRD